MATEHFDIVVIGAGIHGAGIAQAAACYGYRILVLEQSGIASGTSSRSSKLIHGGLRYLETAQFALVRQCLYERNLLLRLAPDLVHMTPFCIPVYDDSSRSAVKVRMGLSIYALLNGLQGSSRFTVVPRRHWDRLDGLSTEGLRTVFRYHDAQTDDAELTKAVLRSAMQFGAELRMPAQFTGAVVNTHCEVRYVHEGRERVCTTKLLINAAGPWVAAVLSKIMPQQAPIPVDMVQGTHIVLRRPVKENAYYLEAPRDKRAIFVLPWKYHTLVGTTETLYRGLAEQVTPLASEVNYLLDTFSHYFPPERQPAGLKDTVSERSEGETEQIIEQFSGLRVLPAGSVSAFRRARDTIIQLDNTASPKVISVYGGKLTAYRATAEKVIHRLLPVLPHRKRLADTRKLKLYPVR